MIRQSEADSRRLNRKFREGEERTVKHPSNAQINRELCIARRALSLSVKDGVIFAASHFPVLAESAPRSGFFTGKEIVGVCAYLAEYLHPVVRFGFVTGWRKDEVLSLQWRNVDFTIGRVRLNPGTTKSGHGRDFPFTAGLEKLIRDQYEKNRELKKRGKLCPWGGVFPKPDGTRIGEFLKSGILRPVNG